MASTAPLNVPPNLGHLKIRLEGLHILTAVESARTRVGKSSFIAWAPFRGRRDWTSTRTAHKVSVSSRVPSHITVGYNTILSDNLTQKFKPMVGVPRSFIYSNRETETTPSEVVGKNDLLIVGPGVLGRLVAQNWREEYPGCQIYGQTLTTDHHEELVELGIVPFLNGQNLPHRFPYVIFCAPPSRSSDYAADLREAALSWNGEGCFVFTSSSAPYDCADGGYCDEDTPVVPLGRSPRTDTLLKAENEVLEHGGCVLRLVGLYKADRGPHSYWLNQGTSDIRPDHILNLIHYEDAASLARSILRKNLRGRVFLGCDNHPLSRQEIMDQVNKSGKFNKKFEAFTGTDGLLGKKLNNSKTRKELQWEPKYASFAQFLEQM